MILAVTNDEYEFPVYIEDTYKAVAKKAGVNECIVSRQCKGISKFSKGKLKFVEVRDEQMD